MASSHRREMELALKKNRGQRIVADWTRRLSLACGVEISAASFLSVEKTQELKSAFFDKVKNDRKAIKAFWERQDKDDLVAHLFDVCIDVRSLPVILFSSVDEFIGAVRVPAECILRNAMSVWRVVEEDLSLATDDLQSGLCLEENFYAPTGEYVKTGGFEIAAWGAFARAIEGAAGTKKGDADI
jgi:hypothetical protein